MTDAPVRYTHEIDSNDVLATKQGLAALAAIFPHHADVRNGLMVIAELEMRLNRMTTEVEVINRLTSPGHRTFDQLMSDMSAANGYARAALNLHVLNRSNP